MRRRTTLIVGALIVVVGAAGAVAWQAVRNHGPSPSRRASLRPCERQYVTLPIARPGTSIPRLTVEDIAHVPSPTVVAFDPVQSDRGVLGERVGRVVSVEGDAIDTGDVLIDLVADTYQHGDGGLLGVTYSPDGAWLFVYRTRRDGTERITVYPVVDGRPIEGRERILLDVPHPKNEQHHGGGLLFGPDGDLYISTGDGGGLGDPRGNGQRLSTLLGKLLRIDPTPAADEPYRVPDDNPFVTRPGARPEIYAYGLRNPFRFSFDDATGDLWLTDVGQSCWEEVNHLRHGTGGGWNFGWDHREGTHVFEGGGSSDDVSPLFDYSHREGWCVIVGGFVYHGRAVPALDGAYLYTDYCKGKVVALRTNERGAITLEDLGVDLDRPVALIEDPDGEPWALSLEGDVELIAPR